MVGYNTWIEAQVIPATSYINEPQASLKFTLFYIDPDWGQIGVPRVPTRIVVTRPDGTQYVSGIYTNLGGYADFGFLDMAQAGIWKVQVFFDGSGLYAASQSSLLSHELMVLYTDVIWKRTSLTYASLGKQCANRFAAQTSDAYSQWEFDGFASWIKIYHKSPSDADYVYLTTLRTDNVGYFEYDFVTDMQEGLHSIMAVFDGDISHPASEIAMDYTVTASSCAIQDTHMVCYPVYPLVDVGGSVDLGVAVYAGLTGYDGVIGSVNVDVYLKPPGAQSYAFYKTLSGLTALTMPYFESYVCNTYGNYSVKYIFQGNPSYKASQCEKTWICGQCTEAVYETCPGGGSIKTQDCVDYQLVPTGNTCPSEPTSMTCQCSNYENSSQLGKQGDTFVLQAWITGKVYGVPNQPIGALPIKILVKKPGSPSFIQVAEMVTGNGGYITHYLGGVLIDTFGRWDVMFKFDGGYVSGIHYTMSQCTAYFDVVECYSGEVLARQICPDNTIIVTRTCVDNHPYETGAYCGESCREAHPTPECQNGMVWDCVADVWVDTRVPCEITPCSQLHPTPLCIGGHIWACIDNVWQDTGLPCEPTPEPDSLMLPLLILGGVAVAGAGIYLITKGSKK